MYLCEKMTSFNCILVGVCICLFTILIQSMSIGPIRSRREGLEPVVNSNQGHFSIDLDGFPDAQRKMAHSSIQFAWDSIRADPAPAGRNFFFSPYSIINAIGMLILATSGSTQAQLQTALRVHPSLLNDGLHVGLVMQNAKLKADTEATFGIANRFYVDLAAVANIDPDYVTELDRVYNASMRRTTFATDPSSSRQEINKFIDESTFGEIKNFLTSDPDPSTRVMLVNAIYFKGLWTSPFKPQFTTPLIFQTNTENVTVDFMYQRIVLPYAINTELGCELICLPYTKSMKYAMYIILPTRNIDLPTLEARLDSVKLLMMQNSLKMTSVEIRMPKFSLSNQMSLRQMLATLGAPDLFDPIRSDYSRMFVASRPGVIVDDIIHEAKVRVDEVGTVASAATSVVGIRNNQIERSIFVNRPFVFFIADQSNGFALFGGRVQNPIEE